MKVGILSMQRVINYGSFLQAFGLKQTIESLGHEVEFVDYEIGNVITAPLTYKNNMVYRLVKDIYINIKYIYHSLKGEHTQPELFRTRYYDMLGITRKPNYRAKVDILVIGSDEVFNCLQTGPRVGYSTQLFGKDNNAKKVITYAASCGTTTIGGLKKYNVIDEVSELLKKIDAISVRDENSFEVVKTLTGKEPYIHLDPVLISDFDKYISQLSNFYDLKDYIIIYSYVNRFLDENEINTIKALAKKYNKKLVSIGFHQTWTDIKINASPFELLAYFKKADFIITDTFHGSVFSIKYNKPFCTIVRESNKQKLSDLLKRFSLDNRVADDISKIDILYNTSIDYNPANKFIEEQTKCTIGYLMDNISL